MYKHRHGERPVSATYRLVTFGNAKRVLFLVDRANLGRQALKEFQQYTTPDDGRKFTELYNVQHLTPNKIDPVARVVITTTQRLFSMLDESCCNRGFREEHAKRRSCEYSLILIAHRPKS